MAPFLLPKVLPQLRRAYTQLKLYLVEDQTARLIELADAREAGYYNIGQAAAATGVAVDLPPATGKRDGSGVAASQPLAAVSGPAVGR